MELTGNAQFVRGAMFYIEPHRRFYTVTKPQKSASARRSKRVQSSTKASRRQRSSSASMGRCFLDAGGRLLTEVGCCRAEGTMSSNIGLRTAIPCATAG